MNASVKSLFVVAVRTLGTAFILYGSVQFVSTVVGVPAFAQNLQGLTPVQQGTLMVMSVVNPALLSLVGVAVLWGAPLLADSLPWSAEGESVDVDPESLYAVWVRALGLTTVVVGGLKVATQASTWLLVRPESLSVEMTSSMINGVAAVLLGTALLMGRERIGTWLGRLRRAGLPERVEDAQ